MTLTAYLGGACLAAEGVALGDLAAEVLPAEAAPACLSPRQAKRLSPQIRLALAVAERLGAALPEDAAWVFASSMGEGETLNVILEALRAPDMLIQPTRFQNAVHNAAGGQWTIAAGLRGPVTSIAGYDETVGAGLLKALMQTTLERRAVGLVAYDVPLPPPLDVKRPMTAPVGAGIALLPEGPGARLTANVGPGQPSEAQTDGAHALVATGNPIAAILPLLEILAGGRAALGLPGGQVLHLEVDPR